MRQYHYSDYIQNQLNFHVFRGFHEEDYHIHSHDFAEFTIITEGECTHIADGFELVLRALLISLIGIILRSYTNQSGKDFENYDKIIPALKYIEEHYSEKITLEMLADQCFLSGRQLSRIFSKIYGMSPIDYLVNYRLTTAYLHILSSDDSVASIAEKCGFYDESHMSRLFLKRFNFSPKSIDKNYDYFRTPKEDLQK
jgi:AraC-like DNA-binding protein